MHVHAGRVFAGAAVHVVPLAVLSLQEVVPCTAEQRVTATIELVATTTGESIVTCEARPPLPALRPAAILSPQAGTHCGIRAGSPV